ncbi:hypothetical protein [Schlesneria sp. DSM 10557]|uniref:hypothetical protein n=1 Tax=Schlesneria sp. DSM 10557 TaxID=3044399 RepID=UPI0035A04270
MSKDYSLPTIGGMFGASDHDRFLVDSVKAGFDDFFPVTIRQATRHLYETGVDALASILKECHRTPEPLTLWTADNFCRESLDRLSLKLKGRIHFRFYQRVEELVEIPPTDVLLYLHFNRYNSASFDFIRHLKQKTGVTVIEDFVQAPLDISRFCGDYALNSLRKFSSLDIAVAYHRSPIPIPPLTTNYRLLRKAAERARSEFLQNPSEEREQLFLQLGRDSDEALAVPEIAPAHTDEIARGSSFDFHSVLQHRKANHQFLAQRFQNEFPEIEILPGEYMYLMITTTDRDRYRRHLFTKRIFPVIHWADSQSEVSKSILSFHIDQRYSENELERVIDEVKEIRSTLAAP